MRRVGYLLAFTDNRFPISPFFFKEQSSKKCLKYISSAWLEAVDELGRFSFISKNGIDIS